MKRFVFTSVVAAASLVSAFAPQIAQAGGCGSCNNSCGRGRMRTAMGMYVAVMTMGMRTPNRATSSVVTTDAPITPAPDAGTTPPPPPAT